MNKLNQKRDEAILVAALKSGDRDAFSTIVTEYRESVIRICRGYVGSKEDAEDIAQEIFIEIYRSAASFRGDSSLSTWIYRMAINRALNWVRDNRKKFRVYRSGMAENERVLENSAGENEGDAESTNADHRKALRFAIDKLPSNQKRAFILNKYEDLSYNEIADILGISLSSVESLLFRAKRNLQSSLSTYYKKNLL